MPLVISSAPVAEPVTLDEAKTHLRINSNSFDEEIMQVVEAAREWCESQVSRTLRASTTRILSMSDWWCGNLQLPYPPALTVSAINYYDADDANQTLAASNYRLVLSTEGPAHVEWDDDVTFPTLAVRPDAVRITYTAGYTAVPQKAKRAILLMLTALWGDVSGKDMDNARRSAGWLLSACDWGSYA